MRLNWIQIQTDKEVINMNEDNRSNDWPQGSSMDKDTDLNQPKNQSGQRRGGQKGGRQSKRKETEILMMKCRPL